MVFWAEYLWFLASVGASLVVFQDNCLFSQLAACTNNIHRTSTANGSYDAMPHELAHYMGFGEDSSMSFGPCDLTK